MLIIRNSRIHFDNASVIEISLQSSNGMTHEFATTLDELEQAIVDLSKIRLMAVIQQEKDVKLSAPAAQEFIAQAKKVRNILMPQEEDVLKAT